MKKSDFNLNVFNEDLKEAVKNQRMNFCKILTEPYGRNITVTAEYCHRPYVKLDGNLNVVSAEESDDLYYGVSPYLNEAMIISAISGQQFSTAEGLDQFISGHPGMFMLHADQSDALYDFARCAVLSAASCFGIRIRLSAEEISDVFRSSGALSSSVKWENGILEVYGSPLKELTEALRDYRFKDSPDGIWCPSSEGKTIGQIYPIAKRTPSIGVLGYYRMVGDEFARYLLP